MPRRIIYIRNPSSGSNFRTINGGGSNRPSTTRRRSTSGNGGQSPTPGPTPGTWVSPSGAIYSSPSSNWYTNLDNTADPLNYSNILAENTPGPMIIDELQMWQPPETLLGDFYDIFIAQVAQGGNIQWPYGTPGTLRGPLAIDAVRQVEYAGNASVFFPGKLPNSNLAHNRFDPRPWWAQ